MLSESDLLNCHCGSIVAPAGCGKTELIARSVARPQGEGTLVLTHTHAGVRALRDRLRRLGVGQRQVHVETIAGWCLRYGCSYPATARLDSTRPVKQQWNSVYDGALRLLNIEAIRKVIRATYSRLLVDEYQDCTRPQHAVITAISKMIPTCVLGDPLQGIFSFAGGSLSWSSEVESEFPSIGTLDYPWRWHQKNEELGRWLLQIRHSLLSGNEIDLSIAPVRWAACTPEEMRKSAFSLMSDNESTIAIRKWPKDAHAFARTLGGLFPSMEEMDCNDLISFSEDMDSSAAAARPARLLRFASECFTELSSIFSTAQQQLDAGVMPDSSRYPRIGTTVAALVQLGVGNSATDLVDSMKLLEQTPGAKLFRKELWREATRAGKELVRGNFTSLREASWALRNRLRHGGRIIDHRAVSRTLLIKGLEFDNALILNADEFEDRKAPGDGAKHFYVAASRGARTLVVLSANSTIRFSPPKA